MYVVITTLLVLPRVCGCPLPTYSILLLARSLISLITIFFFLLFHKVGLSLCGGYVFVKHLKAFEQISSAPIPHADCPTGEVTDTVTYLMI